MASPEVPQTRQEALYPDLEPPVPTHSPKKNPLDEYWSIHHSENLYIDQITRECYVNNWDVP